MSEPEHHETASPAAPRRLTPDELATEAGLFAALLALPQANPEPFDAVELVRENRR